jgi:hypothetical protein
MLERVNISCEAATNRQMRLHHAMTLGDHYLEQLVPAMPQRVHLLHRLVWERAGRRAHRFREVPNDPGIESIGLRQLADSLGKLSYLARVHHGNGQFAYCECGHQGVLPASCCFEHIERRLPLAELRNTLSDASALVGHTPARGLRTAGEVELIFRG